jgi:hypothetical protein
LHLHRQNHPSDPWIDYYTALRQRAAGQEDSALASVERAERASDESLRALVQSLKSELDVDRKNLTQVYLQNSDQRTMFPRLANSLAIREDWNGVLELAQLQASTASASSVRRSAALYWEAKAHWNLGHYDQALGVLSPWPGERLTRLESHQISELCEIAVRSALRAGKTGDAEEFARRARDDYGNEKPELMAAVAKNDGRRVRELLSESRVFRDAFDAQIDRDLELKSLLRDPGVADLRRARGISLPRDYSPRKYSLVLFFAVPLTAEEVERRAKRDGRLSDVETIPSVDGRSSRVWRFAPDTLVLSFAEGPYSECSMLPETLPADDPLCRAYQQHGGWAAIDVIPGESPERGRDFLASASRLAASLAAGATCCYLSAPAGQPDRMELVDKTLVQQIAAGNYFRPNRTPSKIDEFFLASAGLHDRSSLHWQERQQLLRQLADHARLQKDAGYNQLRVRLTLGHAIEDHWLTTIRCQRSGSTVDEIIAEVTTTSRLWPHLTAGERVRLHLFEPLEIRPLASR